MDTSPFGSLSGEVRNRVYHYFFRAQLAAQADIDIRDIRTKRAYLKTNKKEVRNALAFTAVSRQLRAETLGIFWSTISLRVVADTLTAYSFPNDPIPDVRPMNRANHINQDRAANLRLWLLTSGIRKYRRTVRPIEIDLGLWDPLIYAYDHQHLAMKLLEENVQALTRPLRRLASTSNKNAAEDCTLIFKVQVTPSTAMGIIRVPNELARALSAMAKLCAERQLEVRATFEGGMLTRFGYTVLNTDIITCRAVAELLLGYIVEKKAEKSSRPSRRLR
jgi:hypothetical protein